MNVQNNANPAWLAAIDIDDTLLGPDGKVSPENREAVRRLQEAGVEVILASGRALANMLPFHRSLGLSGYIVSEGGPLAQHPDTGEVLYRRTIPAKEASLVIEDGLTRGLTVLCFGHDAVYARELDPWTEQYCRDAGTVAVRMADPRHLPEGEIFKIIWAASPERIDTLAPVMNKWYFGRLATPVSHPYFLEFTAAGANKAAGVSAVARRLGIPRSNVMAFGDGNNDVEMLDWAGAGVAMAYGSRAARKAARYISPMGNPETALARSIDLVLEKERLVGAYRRDHEVRATRRRAIAC